MAHAANGASSGPRPPAAAPQVTEVKRYVDGREKRFGCSLVRAEPGHVVLSFVSDRANRVAGLDLPVGMVTHGHYWPDRPYNVYHWMRPDGSTIALYVNICDEVELGGAVCGPRAGGAGAVDAPGLLSWRDLYLDVIIRPDGSTLVLDRDELPADMAPALRQDAEAAVEMVLQHAAAIQAEVEGDPDRLPLR